jgi:hypothetical protein
MSRPGLREHIGDYGSCAHAGLAYKLKYLEARVGVGWRQAQNQDDKEGVVHLLRGANKVEGESTSQSVRAGGISVLLGGWLAAAAMPVPLIWTVTSRLSSDPPSKGRGPPPRLSPGAGAVCTAVAQPEYGTTSGNVSSVPQLPGCPGSHLNMTA